MAHDQVEAMTLGHRMIVMNGNRAEQIRTPAVVYTKSATTFVAGFIGSPPMNLLHGQLAADGNRFKIENAASIALPFTHHAIAGHDFFL